MDRVRWGTSLLLLLLTPAGSALAAPLAYVANHGDDNVSIIDTATNTVAGTVDVGHRPLGVAVDPEGAHVYVVNQDGPNGNVSIITTANNSVVPVFVGDDPTGVAVKLPGTRVYVANRVDKTVSVIDTATNTEVDTDGDPTNGITRIPVENNPLGVAINPAGTPAYVVNRGSDSVTVIDTDTNTVQKTVTIAGTNPTHVAVSPAGDQIYVTSEGGAVVSVINAASLSVTGTVAVGSTPEGVAFSPDGTRAYVANSGTDTVSVIDTALQQEIATIPVGDQPGDLSMHPAGTRVYVFNRNEKTVSVIDTATNTEIDTDGNGANGITRIPVGIGPVALGEALIPGLQLPRFTKAALGCQAAIAAQARAFMKTDQGLQLACRSRILKDLAAGRGTQQGDALCAALGSPNSTVGRARRSAHDSVVKKCGTVATAALDRPCDRGAGGFDGSNGVAECVLHQHADRVADMVGDTFPAVPKVLSKQGLACQATITKAAGKFAQSEQKQLGACLVRILKDAAKVKSFALSVAACMKALDPTDPGASLPKVRLGVELKIAKKCLGLTPTDIGNPCDPALPTIAKVSTCVLDGQAARVEKMVGAEFNDACPILTAAGLGRAYPGVCTGH